MEAFGIRCCIDIFEMCNAMSGKVVLLAIASRIHYNFNNK